jgi:branched-chain amino acid transport system ATP-binding protein
MLEVRGLEAGYEFLQVLWGISLCAAEGEFISLVGPNGAGKTTLLKAIAGLVKPTQGQILLQGQFIQGMPAHHISQMGISLVSETLNLFQSMSVDENLLLGAYTVRDQAKKRASLEFVFDLFPRLKERRRQLAGTLSGGERKMLAIARGLMAAPRLLLVDEPSMGLSPLLTLAALQALAALRHKGMTILLVEQNVNLALRLTDRAYLLEQGQIILQGPSAEMALDGHVRKAYLGI